MKEQSPLRARNFVIALGIALVAGAAISLYANLHQSDAQYKELAGAAARTFFQAITAMRDWNTRHQGVYVPVTPEVQANEFLVDSLRDITSTQGLRLTKINHAQMTRMVSELLTEERGVRLHITSLQPLRPQNAPDGWEKEALADFAAGREEASRVEELGGGKSLFRYMAPLSAASSCLRCHGEHKQLNEIRGGISVSFSFGPFQRLMEQSNRQIWLVHLTGLCAALLPVGFLGRKLVRNVNALQASLRRVRQLEGFLPICASCKKIRTEGADPAVQDSWQPVEAYIEARTNAEFTHGICPACIEKLYPDLKFSENS